MLRAAFGEAERARLVDMIETDPEQDILGPWLQIALHKVFDKSTYGLRTARSLSGISLMRLVTAHLLMAKGLPIAQAQQMVADMTFAGARRPKITGGCKVDEVLVDKL